MTPKTSYHIGLGLLFLRVGIGILFIFHGLPKLLGGPERWDALGGAMASLGISFAPTFWGFLAAITEVGGGLMLALGLFTRAVCLPLFFTMLVAFLMHFSKGDPFNVYSHPLKAGLIFVALALTGPGSYSLDSFLRQRRRDTGA